LGRASVSIPARHDGSRCIDAGDLARLVIEQRLDEEEAMETAADWPIASRRSPTNAGIR